MQPQPPLRVITVKPITDLVFDASKLKIPVNIGHLLTTCANQLSTQFSHIKQQSVTATITLIPDQSGAFNPRSLPDTAVTFKALDQAIKSKLTSWNADSMVPAQTIAYATFSNVQFLDGTYDAILFITISDTHQLFIKRPSGEHVWFSDAQMAYCKKAKLFFLNNPGYSMSLDFGI